MRGKKRSCTQKTSNVTAKQNSVAKRKKTITNKSNCKRLSISIRSRPKENCNTFKRASSRQAVAKPLRGKNKNSSTVKTHPQQWSSNKNVNGDGSRNKKRKNDNEKEEQAHKRSRLSSHSASHNNSRCNLCKQSEPKPSRSNSATKSRATNLSRLVELPCKKSVFEKACNLRRTIESGDLLPASLQPFLNDSVANKYNTNELVATIKEGKCKWEETEKHMLELERFIRADLCIKKANPDKCLPLLDELNNLEIDALMLKKNPRIIHTVQRLCHYVGSTGVGDFTEEEKKIFLDSTSQIRSKSIDLFHKCQKLFNIDADQPFMRIFKQKVQEYQDTKNSKFLRELCQRVNKSFKKSQISRQLKKGGSGNGK